MNELTREECLKALDDSKFLSVAVINQDGDIDYKGEFKETVVFDLFDKLIQEHFDNPPLKLEELRKMLWEPVFSKKMNQWLLLQSTGDIESIESGELVCNMLGLVDVVGKHHQIIFDEDEFYRKEVKLSDNQRIA